MSALIHVPKKFILERSFVLTIEWSYYYREKEKAHYEVNLK